MQKVQLVSILERYFFKYCTKANMGISKELVEQGNKMLLLRQLDVDILIECWFLNNKMQVW
jgi:hypothetical protein